jgi:hypothetical protein
VKNHYFAMASLLLLTECGEIQKKLFYQSFFSSGKAGEITCVNGKTAALQPTLLTLFV